MLVPITIDVHPSAPRVVVAYGSTFGTTEEIARRVAAALEARTGRRPTLADVAWTEMARIGQHDVLVLGTSTWEAGELQPAWNVAVGALSAIDLRGRRVAVFGSGDRAGDPDTFGEALGTLRRHARSAGAEPIGAFPMRRLGYDPDTFEADGVRNGVGARPGSHSMRLESTGVRASTEVTSAIRLDGRDRVNAPMVWR